MRKSAQYHIRVLQHIRSSLTADVAKTVACALVNSRFDCANAVLYGASEHNLAKLQRAQNALARVVTFTKRADHIQPVLQKLHRLPIKYRVDFKVATIAYKIRQTGCPAYLASSVVECMPTRQLRSSSSLLLQSLLTRTAITCRAFSQAAPRVWNDLPIDIRNSVTFDRFRSALRTHYYRLAFDNGSCTS